MMKEFGRILKIQSSIKFQDSMVLLFSILLSFSMVLTYLLFIPSLTKDISAGLNIRFFTLTNLLLFMVGMILSYTSMQYLLVRVRRVQLQEAESVFITPSRMFFLSFFLNLLCWSIWFLEYFPGAGMNDTINLMMSPTNSMQPWVYQQIIYYGIKWLFEISKDYILSYALMVALQMLFISAVIAWIIKWLAQKQIKRRILYCIIAYYAVSPIVGDYSITLVKDTLFSTFLLLSLPLLYDIISLKGEPLRDRRFFLAFLSAAFGINLLRSNGWMITAAVFLCLLLSKINNKRVIAAAAAFVIGINGVVGVVEQKTYTEDVKFREAVGVPLAQIGAVLNAENGFISPEDRIVLENILPLEEWKNGYRFSFSDPIKFNGHFNNDWLNQHKGEFLRAWFSILRGNFDVYVKAYLCHSYGFWNVSPFNITSTDFSQSFFREINNNTSEDSIWGTFLAERGLENQRILPKPLYITVYLLLLGLFCLNLILGAGIMIWMVFACMTGLLTCGRKHSCLMFAPVIVMWVTMMIGAPASFIYRYSFYLTLSLPITIVMTVYELNRAL